MEVSNETALKTISIYQLLKEIYLGIRTPVTIRAGEVSGGKLRKELENMSEYPTRNEGD